MIGRLALPAMVLAAGLFGVAATGTKFALGGFGPVTVLTIELVSTTVLLWILLLRRGYRRPRSLRRIAVLGIFEPGLAYLLFSFGLTRTTASNGALLSGLESGFVVVLAAIFLHEQIGRSVIAAIAVAVLGMIVLEGTADISGPGVGDLLMTAGALSAAAYTVVARRLHPDDDSLTVTAHQFAVGSLLVLPLAVARWASGAEQFPVSVPAQFWIAASLVGVLGFGASFLLYNAAIVSIAAGSAGVIINLAPAFGLASAVLWLGEDLTPGRLTGAGLIALSVGLFVSVELRGQRQSRVRRSDRPAADEASVDQVCDRDLQSGSH